MKASFVKHTLRYVQPVRTSRGEMSSHTAWYIILENAEKKGYGEAAPLPGLSIDAGNHIEETIGVITSRINDGEPIAALELDAYPSLRFALETALASLGGPTPFSLFNTPLLQGGGIPINGLVWMDSSAHMLKEALTKAAAGFDCIKFKIGALDFDEECRMLEAFRKQYGSFKKEIRLDVNGAFASDEALEKLGELARFDVHSIEQPIRQGQPELMEEICARSPISVALDEELIGLNLQQAEVLISRIKPAYLILKPTLLGGFNACASWIRLARRHRIGWWATSALESNIGLNAIAQWVSTMENPLVQGLGTGHLYQNNIPSPLYIKNGFLYCDINSLWDLSYFSENVHTR